MGWGSIRCLLRWGLSARCSLLERGVSAGNEGRLGNQDSGTGRLREWCIGSGTQSGTGRQHGSLERSLFHDEHSLLKLMDGGSHSLQVNLFRRLRE